MAHHMELAARKVLAAHLEDDEEGIGSHLSIDHLGPTPLGDRVRAFEEASNELAFTDPGCPLNVHDPGCAAPRVLED